MKRLALLIFTIFTYVSAFADQPDFGGPDIPIDKDPTIPNGSTRPLSLEKSDITACYNQAVLTIDIRRDLGNAFIVVSCLGTLNGLMIATNRGLYSLAINALVKKISPNSIKHLK